MEAPDSEGKPRLWLAPFDRRSPPRQIPDVEGRTPMIGPSGEIFFRARRVFRRLLPRSTRTGRDAEALEQPVLAILVPFAGRPMDRGVGSASGQQTVRRPGLSAGRRFPGRHRQQHPPCSGRPVATLCGSPVGRLPMAGLISFRCRRARLPPIPPGDFIPSRKSRRLPGARRIDASRQRPVRRATSTRSIAAPSSAICTAFRCRESLTPCW